MKYWILAAIGAIVLIGGGILAYIFTQKPKCPDDYHYDDATKKCVPNVHACPDGQHWDGTKCVAEVRQCATGYTYSEALGYCVSNTIKCPTGMKWDSESEICVPETVNPPDKCANVNCGVHEVCNNGACDCATGYHKDTFGQCTSDVLKCIPLTLDKITKVTAATSNDWDVWFKTPFYDSDGSQGQTFYTNMCDTDKAVVREYLCLHKPTCPSPEVYDCDAARCGLPMGEYGPCGGSGVTAAETIEVKKDSILGKWTRTTTMPAGWYKPASTNAAPYNGYAVLDISKYNGLIHPGQEAGDLWSVFVIGSGNPCTSARLNFSTGEINVQGSPLAWYGDAKTGKTSDCATNSCSRYEIASHTPACTCATGYTPYVGRDGTTSCKSATGTILACGQQPPVDKCAGKVCTNGTCDSATGNCNCNAGYAPSGGTCAPNTCATLGCDASKHEVCKTGTSATWCECEPGYHLQGDTCVQDYIPPFVDCTCPTGEFLNVARDGSVGCMRCCDGLLTKTKDASCGSKAVYIEGRGYRPIGCDNGNTGACYVPPPPPPPPPPPSSPCDGQPCGAHGSCQALSSTVKVCNCRDGYSGTNCQNPPVADCCPAGTTKSTGRDGSTQCVDSNGTIVKRCY